MSHLQYAPEQKASQKMCAKKTCDSRVMVHIKTRIHTNRSKTNHKITAGLHLLNTLLCTTETQARTRWPKNRLTVENSSHIDLCQNQQRCIAFAK